MLFLAEYEKRKDMFRNPKIKKKKLWEEIRREMLKQGYKVDGTTLDRKLRNMKGTYKGIIDNNKKRSTGRGHISWEYYNRFNEIFTEDKTINIDCTVSSFQTQSDDDVRSPGLGAAQDFEQDSRSNTPTGPQKKRLDVFRKRQLELEEEKLEEVKKIRVSLEEYNKIQREKLELFKKYLNL
ncbi:uncharacterized protein [Onthophagus taurus]|uniref:uncharacterized protein n=1 Tax=Onthophagus taurus TaxID=166361 RepID=UPI0039BE0A1F